MTTLNWETLRRLPLQLGLNPIIIKELRSRMRGPRAFVILTGFLLMLAAVSYLLYQIVAQAALISGGPLSATVGQSMFAGLAFFELFLVAFITPALTAGTISGEHEALTYDMLMATPLRPASILWGKMIAAMSYVFLLIFAAIPLSSLVLIFGGVTVYDLLRALLVLVVCTITFGIIGLFFSVLLHRTGRATVLSYMTLLAFVLGPLFAYVFYGVTQSQEPPRGLLMPSPFTAMASVIASDPNLMGMGSFGSIFSIMSFGVGFVNPAAGPVRPMWHYTLGLYTLISVVLFMLSMLLVRPVSQRQISRQHAIVAGLVLLLLLSVAAWTYDFSEIITLFRAPVPPQVPVRGLAEPMLAPAMPVPAMPVPYPPPPPLD
jgi:ABC-2 type transport system permease protein